MLKVYQFNILMGNILNKSRYSYSDEIVKENAFIIDKSYNKVIKEYKCPHKNNVYLCQKCN